MTNWIKATADEQHPTWDKEKDKSIEGLLVEKRENLGENNSNLFVIEDIKTHDKKAVWGTAILNNTLGKLPVGTSVKITYKGKAKGKRGNQYHDFEVLYDKDTMPERDAVDAFDEL